MMEFLKRALRALLLPIFTKANGPLTQSQLSSEYWAIRKDVAFRIPDSPANFGFSVYSQCDEDGILQNIISRLAVLEDLKYFLEIGAGDGVENNTALLVSNLSWSGIWVDPSNELAIFSRKLGFHPRLRIITEKVLPISDLGEIKSAFVELGAITKNNKFCIGVLSIDIDSYDLDLLEFVLTHIDPEILVLEYNASFAPPLRSRVPFGESNTWEGDNFYGASLSEQSAVLSLNYSLVATSTTGVNSFWVKNIHSNSFSKYSLEDLYSPPRHHLARLSWGHPGNSLKYLKLK